MTNDQPVKYYVTEDEDEDFYESLESMLERYREMRAEIQPSLDFMKAIEKKIKTRVMETGEVAEVDGASVSIRSGYTRTSWDGKALQGYAAAHPEIEQFCKTSEVGPAAVIKVKL